MRFVRQSCVNFNNLISRITQHSRVSVNRSQSSLKLLFFFNSQPCRQIATDIYDLIVDNSVDVLMLTETWLYSIGDEAYIATMTPAGYEFRSFSRTGSRGGGIGFVTKTTMSACISFRALDYKSFEAVQMRLSLDHVSVVLVCLYRPSQSKRNQLTNSIFSKNSQSCYLNMPIHAEMSCILVILTFTMITLPTDK